MQSRREGSHETVRREAVMDWATHDHRPPRRVPASPVRIEVRWRLLMAPSGRVLVCALHEHPLGVEVRCGFHDDDPLRTRVERSLGQARTLATAWLEAVKEKGSCEELPVHQA